MSHISQTASLDVAVASGRVVLALFSAKWCTAGKVLDTQIQPLLSTEVMYKYIDVDLDPYTADYHKVVSLPTALLFVSGEQQAKMHGSFSAKDLVCEIEKSLTRKAG